jgi:hypothetical protein
MSRKYYQIQKMEGIQPDTNIMDMSGTPAGNKLYDAKNIKFIDGWVKPREGYAQLGSTISSAGDIKFLNLWENVINNDQIIRRLIAWDGYDVYLDSTIAPTWPFATEEYNTGTASCAGATDQVTGIGTFWEAWTSRGYQIKFGTTDSNVAGTPDTWYTISTCPTNTHLHLTVNGPNTGGAVNYVIRKKRSGTLYDMCSPVNINTWSSNIVITHGIYNRIQKNADPVTLKFSEFANTYIVGTVTCAGGVTAVTGAGTTWLTAWTGKGYRIKFGTHEVDRLYGTTGTWYTIATVTGAGTLDLTINGPVVGAGTTYVIQLGTCPDGAKYCAWYGGRLILAYVTDGVTEYPRSIWWSSATDYTDFNSAYDTTAGYTNLFKDQSPIVGMKQLGNRLMIYKQSSIVECLETGDPTNPFIFNENAITTVGAYRGGTIVDFETFHIFCSKDGIYIYDGSSVTNITQNINSPTSFTSYTCATKISKENSYLISGETLPGTTYNLKLNLDNNTWVKNTFANEPHSLLNGSNVGMSNLYYFGATAGKVYLATDGYYTDNATNITKYIQTPYHAFGDTKHAHKIYEIILHVYSLTNFTISGALLKLYSSNPIETTLTIAIPDIVLTIGTQQDIVINTAFHCKNISLYFEWVSNYFNIQGVTIGYEDVGETLRR